MRRLSDHVRHPTGGIRRRRPVLLGTTAIVCAAFVAGCGSNGARNASSTSKTPSGTVAIAMQQDLAFSPLYIIDQEHWLTRALPHVKVHWEILNSGAAIQTGMISDKINVGALGVAPFLIGEDKGVPWKLLSSISESDMSLVVKPSIKSFRGITSSDRIAVVSPTSIEAIALEKMTQTHLGKATALTANYVTMTQPEAAQAFSAGSIAGVVAVQPYTSEEIKHGGHVLDTSYGEFGKSTLDSVAVNTAYYRSNPAIARELFKQIQRAVHLLRNDPTKAASILATYYHGQESRSTLYADITNASQSWTIVPTGYLRYAKFMKQIGLIDSVPRSMAGLEEPTLAKTPGS